MFIMFKLILCSLLVLVVIGIILGGSLEISDSELAKVWAEIIGFLDR